jgi:hypothetical protein
MDEFSDTALLEVIYDAEKPYEMRRDAFAALHRRYNTVNRECDHNDCNATNGAAFFLAFADEKFISERVLDILLDTVEEPLPPVVN